MSDIRKQTCLIIRKNGEYLVGTIMGSRDLKWSGSMWDAWRTRIRANAASIARKVGGEIMLFNPICGEIREYRE